MKIIKNMDIARKERKISKDTGINAASYSGRKNCNNLVRGWLTCLSGKEYISTAKVNNAINYIHTIPNTMLSIMQMQKTLI